MARRRISRMLTVAALAVATQAVTTVAVADPPGTVVLASGSSAFADHPELDGLTTTAAIFRDSLGIQSVPLTGGSATTVVPGSPSDLSVDSVIGDMLFYENSTGRFWLDLDNNATGPVPDSWTGFSTDGGLYSKLVGSRWHLFDQNAETHAKKDLGMLPKSATGFDAIIGAPAGDAVTIYTGAQPVVVFFPAGGGMPVTLNTTGVKDGLECGSVVSGAVGCNNYVGASNKSRAVRLPTDGSAPITGPATSDFIETVAVTTAQTGWFQYPNSGGSAQFITIPAAGGAPSSSPVPGDPLLSNDALFYFGLTADLGVDGVYSTAAANDARTAVYIAPAGPLQASSVVLTPGRAVWSDDSAVDFPVWNRSISTSGGTITAGAATLLGSGMSASGTGYGLPESVSDSKTTLLFPTGSTADGIAVIDGNGARTTLPGRSYQDRPEISGNRVSYVDAQTADPVVYDLVTGATTDLTASYGAMTYQHAKLSGSEAAFSKPDGSVYQVDLDGTGPPIRVAGPPGHSEGPAAVANWGDWVAFTQAYRSNGSDVLRSGAVNTRTKAKVTLPASAYVQSASNAGVVVQVYGDNGTTTDELVQYSGDVVDLPGSPYVPPTVDGSIVGWVGTDGAPRVSPLGVATTDRPRSLGDPDAPAAVARSAAFPLDLPTSAALASCSVTITGPAPATTKVTKLSCDATKMAAGEVAVSWNVPASQAVGTYTWKVTAANADGALQAADGSKSAVTGTVVVS